MSKKEHPKPTNPDIGDYYEDEEDPEGIVRYFDGTEWIKVNRELLKRSGVVSNEQEN